MYKCFDIFKRFFFSCSCHIPTCSSFTTLSPLRCQNAVHKHNSNNNKKETENPKFLKTFQVIKFLKFIYFIFFSLLLCFLQCESKIMPFNFKLCEYPYLVNLAQEFQFLTNLWLKNKPILRLACHRQPSNELFLV